jgi:hypothetical protein
MWQQWNVGRHGVGNSGALTMDRRALNADGLAKSLSNAVGMKDTQRGATVQAIGDGRAKHGQVCSNCEASNIFDKNSQMPWRLGMPLDGSMRLHASPRPTPPTNQSSH